MLSINSVIGCGSDMHVHSVNEMLKTIPVEAQALHKYCFCLECKVARSKRNAHSKDSVLQGVSLWLREMSTAN